jgi:hypothetical protein
MGRLVSSTPAVPVKSPKQVPAPNLALPTPQPGDLSSSQAV